MGNYHTELYKTILFLATFNTLFEKFRFTRMQFGLNVAEDAFQHMLDTIFNNLDPCKA